MSDSSAKNEQQQVLAQRLPNRHHLSLLISDSQPAIAAGSDDDGSHESEACAAHGFVPKWRAKVAFLIVQIRTLEKQFLIIS